MRLKKLLKIFIPVVLIIGIVFCVIQLVGKVHDYHVSDSYYHNIKENVIHVDSEIASLQISDALHIDWEAQKDTNCVAWLELDDISYPVYHDDGSQWYLNHLPDGTYASAGSIFLYGNNSFDFSDKSSFIYGHNMFNGSMFGRLKDYASAKYKDHKFFLYLPDGTRHSYQFFAIASVPSTSDAYTWSFPDETSFLQWQQGLKERSLVQCVAPVDGSKRFVTLSTCNGSTGTTRRLIIVGQEIAVEHVQSEASWYAALKEQKVNQKNEAINLAYQKQAELDSLYMSNQKEDKDE